MLPSRIFGKMVGFSVLVLLFFATWARAASLKDLGIDLANPKMANVKAAGLKSTYTGLTTLSLTKNLTIDAGLPTVGATVGSTRKVVLNLTDLSLSKDVVLTLKGAANTVFVINVKRNFTIASAKVLLLGGVTQGNVLFNYVGTGAPRISGTSKLTGTLLSLTSTSITGGSVVQGSTVGAPTMAVGGSYVGPATLSR